MAKNEVDKVTEEAIAKGGILVKMYFDMRHKEKEKLQPLMADLINERLMKEPGIIYCYGAIEEPLEREGIFITSASLNVLFKDFSSVMNVSFKYAPAGLEIEKPANGMTFKPFDLQKILMDMADISMNYSKYVFERVLSKEEKDAMMVHMHDRTELGKKFLADRKKDEKK